MQNKSVSHKVKHRHYRLTEKGEAQLCHQQTISILYGLVF